MIDLRRRSQTERADWASGESEELVDIAMLDNLSGRGCVSTPLESFALCEECDDKV